MKGLKTVSDILINKPEIRTLIPHSGLMCLLDSVTEWDDQSIICISNTHRDPANPLRAAPSGYLAALRDARLQVMRLDDIASPLQICAYRLFGDANAVYECRVLAGDVLLADGRITIMLRM